MTGHETVGQELAKGAGLVAGHIVAVVVGLALMIAGLGMGVTIVLLPIGIPVGLLGLFAFIWGLFGWTAGKPEPVQPPSPK
jgi:hypothetical protein